MAQAKLDPSLGVGPGEENRKGAQRVLEVGSRLRQNLSPKVTVEIGHYKLCQWPSEESATKVVLVSTRWK